MKIQDILAKSIEFFENKLQLKNDLEIPGNDKYYGTGPTGTKGYHDLPAEVELPTDLNAATPGNDKYYGTDGTGVKGYHDLPAEVELPTDLNAVAPGVSKYYGTDVIGVKGYHDLPAEVELPTDLNAVSPGTDKYYGTDDTGTKGYHDLPSMPDSQFVIIYLGSIQRVTGTIVSYDEATSVLTGSGTQFLTEVTAGENLIMGPRYHDGGAPQDAVFAVTSVLTDTTLEGTFYYSKTQSIRSPGNLVFPFEPYQYIAGDDNNSGLTPFDGMATLDRALEKCIVSWDILTPITQFYISLPLVPEVKTYDIDLYGFTKLITISHIYVDELDNYALIPEIVHMNAGNRIILQKSRGDLYFNNLKFESLMITDVGNVTFENCELGLISGSTPAIGLLLFLGSSGNFTMNGGAVNGSTAAVMMLGPGAAWLKGTTVTNAVGAGIVVDVGAILYTTAVTNTAALAEVENQFGDIRAVTPPSL